MKSIFSTSRVWALISSVVLFSGCAVLDSNSSKYGFSDGYYFSKLNNDKSGRYYVVTGSDSIKVYPFTINRQLADTVKSITLLFPPHEKPSEFSNYKFTTQSFDLDVLTILFKYRPTLNDFPSQLNANFNGALYGGYRKDVYKLLYQKTPLRTENRNIAHFGYSVGAFAGIGAARIDEYVTLNRINYEYDGAVLTTGVAGIFGFNKLNFGINCGFDFLTDKNRLLWLNQSKPWVGVSIGLNLN